jgi:hypothetical protein
MIELGYLSDPDEYGVHDGCALAKQLLSDAYRLLIPYAGGCPACTDEILRALASQVAAEIRKAGMTSIVFSDTRRGLDKAAASTAHLRRAQARTAELLQKAPPHEHLTGLRAAS